MHRLTRIRLLFFSIFVTAMFQFGNANEKVDSLTHIVIGHKCLFDGKIAERFELNYERNKLYRLTIHANYLHIKGEKYRTKIKTTKSQWKALTELVSKLQPGIEETQLNNEYDYFISYSKNGHVISEFRYSDEDVPKTLLDILDRIRKTE